MQRRDRAALSLLGHRVREMLGGFEYWAREGLAVATADGVARPAVDPLTAVARYPKDAFPTAKVYGPTADPQLRLITCGGDFDRGTGHYVDNVVAFGHLVA